MSDKRRAARFKLLFFLSLAACSVQPVFAFADLDSDMRELGRPFNKAGRAIGNQMNSWTGKAEDYTGTGDNATDSFMCSDPGFFVIRLEHGITGAQSWILKGFLRVPAPGYLYHYRFMGVRGVEGFVRLDVGVPVKPMARPGQEANGGSLQVIQKIDLPANVALLHIVVAGGALNSQEIRCDLTPAPQNPVQDAPMLPPQGE